GDIFSDDMYAAPCKAGVLDRESLQAIKPFLQSITPRPAVFDRRYVRRLDGPHVKAGKTKMDLAEQVREDIREFKASSGATRLVMMWCGSTTILQRPSATLQSIEAFEEGLDQNDPNISPSMIYAYAALSEGVPFANGAPNLTVDIPAMHALARRNQAPICGKDFKSGQTLIKTILAPGFKARMLGLRDADQDQFSLSGLNPGGAHCPRPGAVPGPGAALRRAPRHRNPRVAQLLLQVADDGSRTVSGARLVHSVHEAEEHVAPLEEG